MLYLGQVIIYTGIFYLIYVLLLRNKPMHQFNRVYLLSIITLPVVIPFVKLSALASFFEKSRVADVRLPEIAVNNVHELQTVANAIDWVAMTYWTVALTMLVLFIRKWLKLRTVIKHATRLEEPGSILLLNTGYGPGSWGKYILLPDEEIHETIVAHEAAHIRMGHSKDIVLINIVQCIFWPNLFLHAIKIELKQVHEFQADAAVGIDRLQYGELLLSNVFKTCTLPLTHSFNIHPLKRRLMMLKKRISRPIALTVGLVAVLATCTLLFNMIALQSCKTKKWEVLNATQVDKMATFNGDYMKFMSENIVYPREAIDKKIEGRVAVQITIADDGSVTEPKVLTEKYIGAGSVGVGANSGILAKAALEVIAKMPKWIPAEKNGKKVAVVLTMPISFKLPDPGKSNLTDKKTVSFKVGNDKITKESSETDKKAYAQAIMNKVVTILENDGAIPIKDEISEGELDAILAKSELKKQNGINGTAFRAKMDRNNTQ